MIARHAGSKGANAWPITKGDTRQCTHYSSPPTSTPTWMPTSSRDPTAPTNICLLQPVHQGYTESNNRHAIFEDNAPDNNNANIADDLTVQANNCINGTTLGTSLQLVRQSARHSNTPMVLTNPHASTVHDLQPTVTPTLIPQPQLLQSTPQQPIANLTRIEPQCLLWSTMPTIEPTKPKVQQPYPHYIAPHEYKRDKAI
jgi:hypothetical protein